MQISAFSGYTDSYADYSFNKKTQEQENQRFNFNATQSVKSPNTDSKTIFADDAEKSEKKNSQRDEENGKNTDKAEFGQEKECQTCKERKYVDGSDDPGVSFKSPGKINADVAAVVVGRHEREHVARNRAKAQREGGEVISQSVTLHTGICPECGRIYVSGGTTYSVTRNISKNEFAAALEGARGNNYDRIA